MSKFVKDILKLLVRWSGYEIKKIDKTNPYEWLKEENINTILDVGANTGQFALRLNQLLPQARLYSFEPLKDCYIELLKNTKHISRFRAFNFALGDENTESQIYRNAYSQSSSFLRMEKLHVEAFPATKDYAMEKVNIRRLDDVAEEIDIVENLLIKIDVQGFEDRVIRGGEKTVRRAAILIVETSFVPLYKEQLLFENICEKLKQLGFEFNGAEDTLRNPNNGRILQCNSIFTKAANCKRTNQN